MPRLVNETTGAVVLAKVEIADSFWKRLKGLQFRYSFPRDAGLWLSPCRSLHTCFMRFSIDVFMLDRSGKVLQSRLNVNPWRIVLCPQGTHAVLETQAGAVDLKIGSVVQISDSE